MRPLKLTLAGFRSHAEPSEISFEGRRLFAIVGPTGSGKSSILDAISYALYGKTPGEQRSKKRLICSKREAAQVQLSFAVDGDEYEITRVLRATGAGEHVITDLSSGDKVTGESKVSQRVEELLGLDFDGFCSSVLLAQGKFSQLLKATPESRGQILKGVFRLEEIDDLRAAAKTRANEIALTLAGLQGERQAIPSDAEGTLATLKGDKVEAEKRAAEFEKAIPEEKRLLDAIRSTSEDIARLEDGLKATEASARALPSEDEWAGFVATEAELVPRRRQAEEHHAECVAILKRVSDSLEEAHAKVGDVASLRRALVQAEGRPHLEQELARLLTSVSTHEKQVTDGTGRLAETEQAESAARSAVEAVSQKKIELEQAHAAHILRDELSKGEPCPVCEQVVTALPKGSKPASLEALEAEARTSAATLETATAAVAAGRHVLELAKSRLVDAGAAVESQRGLLADLEAKLREIAGDDADPAITIAKQLGTLEGFESEVAGARKATDQARAKLDEVTVESDRLARTRRTIAGRLIEIAGQVGGDRPDVDDETDVLAKHATEVRIALEGALGAGRAQAAQAKEMLVKANELLEELRDGLDLEAALSIEAALAEWTSAAKVAAAQISELEGQIKRAASLDKKIAEQKARQELFTQLATDLTARKFINFLLEERARLLMELASERLVTMTGRYRLAIDEAQSMEVIDELDADKRRNVATLSGGESFLASLALALALADVATREGGRLQCFFLDEGFGSLDPEALDHAIDGIERIVSDDRVIGLVSHVAAVAQRVEDKIVLEKGPDAMTIVASGASA